MNKINLKEYVTHEVMFKACQGTERNYSPIDSVN